MPNKCSVTKSLVSKINKQIENTKKSMEINIDIKDTLINISNLSDETNKNIEIIIDCNNIKSKIHAEQQQDILESNSFTDFLYKKFINALNGYEYEKITTINNEEYDIVFVKKTEDLTDEMLKLEDFDFQKRKYEKNNKKNQLNLF